MDHNEILKVKKEVYGNDIAERIGSMAASVSSD
jgi:hypothetical protein